MQKFVNKEAEALSGEAVGFSFGENWQKLLSTITTEQADLARESLIQSLDGRHLEGSKFIDAGCGSGLFSLAAFRLGADVTSVDIDPSSIACVSKLQQDAGSPQIWKVVRASLLDENLSELVGQGSVVYCWGVLHHTGAMWEGFERVASLVAPGGVLCTALYNRPRRPKLTMALKRIYNRTPRVMRPFLVCSYGSAALLYYGLALRRNPVTYVRQYGEKNRGMNYWRDVEDWLGGLPFEYAEPEEVVPFAEARGFAVLRVKKRGPGANNEYLLQRVSGDTTNASPT